MDFLSRVGFHPLTGARVTQDGHPYQPMVLDFGPGSVDGWLAELVANELSVADALHLDRAARELVLTIGAFRSRRSSSWSCST